ncbi:hypothetical protein KL938_002612, partial [Ogataea parapolymorpha]
KHSHHVQPDHSVQDSLCGLGDVGAGFSSRPPAAQCPEPDKLPHGPAQSRKHQHHNQTDFQHPKHKLDFENRFVTAMGTARTVIQTAGSKECSATASILCKPTASSMNISIATCRHQIRASIISKNNDVFVLASCPIISFGLVGARVCYGFQLKDEPQIS